MPSIEDLTKKAKKVNNVNNPNTFNFQLPPVPLNLQLPKINIGAAVLENRPQNNVPANMPQNNAPVDIPQNNVPINIPQNNVSSFNLFSPLQDTKDASPEPYDSLLNIPLHSLDDSISCLLDNTDDTDSINHQSNNADKEVAPNVRRNPNTDKVMRDLFGPTPLNSTVQPQLNGAMEIRNPIKKAIGPEQYLENVLVNAVNIWLSNFFGNGGSTFFAYRYRVGNFIKFMINENIKLPCENDIVSFYNNRFFNKNANIAKSNMSPIMTFFSWAQMNNIYYDICKNLRIRTVRDGVYYKSVLKHVSNTDPEQENEMINQFINQPSKLKNIIMFVNSWINEANFGSEKASQYRAQVLHLIGYLQNNELSLNQESINAYLSEFYWTSPTYAKIAEMAIREFCMWLKSKGKI